MKLTPDEIRLTVFVLLALVIGALIQNYRHKQRIPATLPAEVAPASPGTAEQE